MEQIHKILKGILTIVENSDIEYYASGGTLLGAVRHQDIIPWDDDIDLDIEKTPENIRKIEDLEGELKNKGYILLKTFFGYKIYPVDGKKIRYNPWFKHINDTKRLYPKLNQFYISISVNFFDLVLKFLSKLRFSSVISV